MALLSCVQWLTRTSNSSKLWLANNDGVGKVSSSVGWLPNHDHKLAVIITINYYKALLKIGHDKDVEWAVQDHAYIGDEWSHDGNNDATQMMSMIMMMFIHLL